MASDNTNINFLKLDTENGSELIEDLDLEQMELTTSISPFETAYIDGMLIKSFKSILHIPTYQDLVKIDIELAKSLSKIINSDKNQLNNIMNRLLSIDFKDNFIFSQNNLSLISIILINIFGEIKKFKISTYVELETKIKSIDFSKYNDIEKKYIKKQILERKGTTTKIAREKRLDSTLLSQLIVKEIDEEWTEINDPEVKLENKYYGKQKGLPYIDNNNENCLNSSLLTKDYNYDEEQRISNLLTNKSFNFVKVNKDDAELPLELIILLYKLKEVKTLIFQIQNANETFIKMALFILMNVKWLFMHQIEEIKLDLIDPELQKKLNKQFNQRAAELYEDFNLSKNYTYFNGYFPRKNNFWMPEGDILFEKVSFNKNNNYLFSNQFDIKKNTFDDTLYNIYNEFGFITNFKYIRPITYTMNILCKGEEFIKEQSLTQDIDESVSYYHTNSINIMKSERKNNSILSPSTHPRNTAINISLNLKKENSSEKSTTNVIKEFLKNNTNSFQLMSIYFFFLTNFQNLKKFCLYFDFSYSIELQYMFSLSNSIYDRFHFLIFANNINTLTEANFSFNSLDCNAFENILGIIKKNKNLTSLKMSLFSQEINYSENFLFYLWSQKKIGLNKLFKEQNEAKIQSNVDIERNIVYFILHNSKILDSFVTNMKNLFNLLKFESCNTLEEIIFRFDLPIPILNSDKYKNLLVKFILNLLILLSLQINKIKTFKILAPELPFDAKKMPIIQKLFKEIGEQNENTDEIPESKSPRDGTLKNKINLFENHFKNKKSLTFNNLSNDSSIPRNQNQSCDDNEITKNEVLEDITLNIKFYELPEIFNIIYINNIQNLKKINLGLLDQVTFISFLNDYKLNNERLQNLISLKIGLCPFVINYADLDKYILDYINVDTPNLQEKYLFSNLKILTEIKMNELIDNVYYIAKVPKLVVEIGNYNDNIHLLSKSNKKLIDDRNSFYTLRMIMDVPQYQKMRAREIINCLAGFYHKKDNRIIICKENPNENY